MSTEVGGMSERNVTDDSRQVCTILCRSLEELSRTVQLSLTSSFVVSICKSTGRRKESEENTSQLDE